MTSAPPSVAWFRVPLRDASDLTDEVPALLDELAPTAVEVFDEPHAHEFVWRHAQRPYDVCVYELDDTPAHQFIWPYLFHYPGIFWPRRESVHRGRALLLDRDGRRAEAEAEAAFNLGVRPPAHGAMRHGVTYADGPLLRAPVSASKLIVAQHAATAASLEVEFPDAHIRHIPTGISAAAASRLVGAPRRSPRGEGIAFGVLESCAREAIERAMRRAVEGGAPAYAVFGPAEVVIPQSDVLLALEWPPTGRALTGALYSLAAAKPVVVFEGNATADWPAFDPQTWQPRGVGNSPPIAVSIDPRDEEHSLVLAIRRLATDAMLREQLGTTARGWWREHGTVARAAKAWRRVLDEARSMPAPPRPADWPRHFSDDGTALVRKILSELGVTLDILS